MATLEGGINSGVSPLLLEKNQLAFGLNLSLRGGYAKTRPPVQIKILNYNGNAVLQSVVEKGLFQGGGYYRPDFGTESLIAQISGRLIKFTEVSGVWNVSDISVPEDLNNPTSAQVWMWQSENYLIVSDGTTALPIFFDGTTSRRSFGASVLLGTATAFTPSSPPAIGDTVVVTLTTPYAGLYNIPVLFNGEFYQTLSGQTVGYEAILTNIHATAGTDIPVGTQLSTNPINVGYISGITAIVRGAVAGFAWTAYLNFSGGVPPVSVGDNLIIESQQWQVTGIAGTQVQVSQFPIAGFFPNHSPINSGDLVQYSSTSQPAVVVGTVVTDATSPAVGSSITILISQPYSGAANRTIWIGNDEYQISPPPIPGSTTSLTLINLTDTSTSAYVNPSTIMSVPEIPSCRMGAYGMGRNWFSLIDGISYEAGDIVGGGAGTPANNFRDSVLKTTENDFLAGGGRFRLPGSGDIITAMRFTANLDASLGQGVLQIGTAVSMFSNNSPADRTQWAALTNPIQSESLIDKGPLGQNSTILVNSDLFFRSYEGIASLVLARRDFNTWGNRPQSNEMQRPLNSDTESLLGYGSAMTFDNRFVVTCAPGVSAQGVFHQGAISLNFDLISSLRSTLPPSWEQLFTGVNILQVLNGRVNGTRRAFAFTLNFITSKIELYEFLPEKTIQFQDNNTTDIGWFFESAALFNKDIKPMSELIQLLDGECYLSGIEGDVHVKIMYRPDYFPCWTPWREFDVCADVTADGNQPGYRMRIGFGEPDVAHCEPGNNRPLRIGYFFQFRVEITGKCTWNGMRVSANSTYQTQFAPIECDLKSCQAIECDTTDDFSFYGLQGFPPAVPASPTPFFPFHNDAITLQACASGVIQFTTPPPSWVQISGGNLIAVAGSFGGQTQIQANATATAVLQTFIESSSTSGNLTCFSVSCVFSPSSLSGVLLNTPFSQQLELGGLIQGVWTLVGGVLPNGLSLSSAGLLSGIPTQSGTFNIIVHVNGTGINCNNAYAFLVYENMLTNFVEYYTLNETGTSSRASTPTNQPLVPNGGGNVAAIAGILGSAFLCPSGANNFLQSNDALIDPGETFNNTSYSLSLWLNRQINITTGVNVIDTIRSASTFYGWQLSFDSANTKLRWSITTDTNVTANSTYVSIPNASQWYHYVVTFDKTTQVLNQYLNGVLVATDNLFTVLTGGTTSRKISLGKFMSNASFGAQAVGLWNAALTANQVLHLYNNGSGIPYPF